MTHIALSSQQRSLVKELADAWQSGSVVIPAEGMLPSDLDTAEAMQDELARALDFVCGAHKLGATVRAVRERLGLARTFYGIVPRERVLRSPATIRASSARFRLVECEPAFRFKREIPAGRMTIGPDEVAEAIGSILPAMELPESRFASIGAHGPFALVADGGAAGWVVLGPEQPFDGSERWDNAEATLEIDGHEVARGFAREIEGGPFAALVAHCSTMVARGRTIPAGLVVLPGSCTGAVAVPAGSTATAKFGRFGEVRITFPTD